MAQPLLRGATPHSHHWPGKSSKAQVCDRSGLSPFLWELSSGEDNNPLLNSFPSEQDEGGLVPRPGETGRKKLG